MRELKELLCEGERVYELTRCASSPVYFIGPETDDINHMDVSGALEDTLHRMVDAGFTERQSWMLPDLSVQMKTTNAPQLKIN